MVAPDTDGIRMSGYRSRSRTPDSRYGDDHYRSDSFVSDGSDYDRHTPNYTPSPRRKYTNKKGGKGPYKNRSKVGAGSKMTGGRATNNKDYLKRRVLSAKRLKEHEVRNEVDELQSRVQVLTDENRTLQRMQRKQEHDLEKFQGQEGELPQLLNSHNREVKALRDQIRKQKEKYNRADRKLRDTEDELRRTKKQLKKLEDLNSDKNLEERERLANKLTMLEAEFEGKDKKCQSLERYVDNLIKTKKSEMLSEMSKHKETRKKYMELQEEFDKLKLQVKEKEKELAIKNIYANRIVKAPHHLSTQSTPTPLPPARKKKTGAQSVSPKLSPREKAKHMEEKRREDQMRIREKHEQKKKQEQKRPEPKPAPRTPSFEEDQIEDETKREDSFYLTQSDKENSLFADAEKRDREEKEKRQREDKDRKAKEDKEKKKAKEEERLRKEREQSKRKSEEHAKREKEERERQHRERMLKEEHEKGEIEEAERIGREEREKRMREERQAEENYRKNDDDRKKKDLLLAKLKEIDIGGAPSSPASKKAANTSTNWSPNSIKKTYNFTNEVENMHNGKPSHDDITVQVLERNKQHKKSDDLFDDDFGGGYNPSFTSGRRGSGRSGSTQKPGRDNNDNITSDKTDNKSNLMSSLFGTGESKSNQHSSFGEDDIFSSSTKAKPVADKKAYPWENQMSARRTSNLKSNSDNVSSGNSPLLSRRPRQQATAFHAKPTVNAIDDIDDDIEEVIL